MKTIDKVLKLLNEDSRTRDSDELLTALIWLQETDINMSADKWLLKYSQRGFTSAESIRRCRQKLQEEFQGLRGKSYLQRKKIKHQTIYEN